jgi:N-acetylglucosaminyl-diphospho-decaprenol L-rhamnosyltransferase
MTAPTCPRLVISIVNYRTAPQTIECLRALAPQVQDLAATGTLTQVVVVDNASGDDSVVQVQGAIAQNHWQWATCMPSSENGGFAYGNNLAIRLALAHPIRPDYFLLLNPDTVVRPGALQHLVAFMDATPAAGLAGSSFENEDGSPWPYAFRFPSILGELEDGLRLGIVSRMLEPWNVVQTMGASPAQVDWLSGACLMVRRSVIEAIGLMDEEYFLYCEEMDFCLQARRAGWPCWYVPASRVMHIRGKSTGLGDQQPTDRRPMPTYWFHSRRRFWVKNYGLVRTALADGVWIGGFSLWKVRQKLQGKPDCDPPNFLTDFIRNSVFSKGRAIAKGT